MTLRGVVTPVWATRYFAILKWYFLPWSTIITLVATLIIKNTRDLACLRTTEFFRTLKKLLCRKAVELNHLVFLRRCRDNDIIPKGLMPSMVVKLAKAMSVFKNAGLALVRATLGDNRQQLYCLMKEILTVNEWLKVNLQPNYFETGSHVAQVTADKTFAHVKLAQLKKFTNLCSPVSVTQRYQQFEHVVTEVAEKIVGKHKSCGLPSWVTDKTIQVYPAEDGKRWSQNKVPDLQVKAVKRKVAEAQFQSEWVLQIRQSSHAEQTNGRPHDCRLQGRIHHHMENHPSKGKKTSAKVNKRDGQLPLTITFKEGLRFHWQEGNVSCSAALPVAVVKAIIVHCTSTPKVQYW